MVQACQASALLKRVRNCRLSKELMAPSPLKSRYVWYLAGLLTVAAEEKIVAREHHRFEI